MNRKLLISLGPLLAVAALAVVPAASQGVVCTAPACPHVYKNGVAGGEGQKVREIWWGTLKLKNQTLGEVICHDIFGAFDENPTGGGNAKGQVQGFYAYECEDKLCTETLKGKGIKVTPGRLPWLTEVFETAKKEFRLKIGHKGPTPNIEPNPLTEPGSVDFTVECEGVTGGKLFGELDPLILNNGISIGSGPGQMKLEPESINPESHNLESEVFKETSVEGAVKLEGYGAEELIEVKNP
jgi:hypothetical protein